MSFLLDTDICSAHLKRPSGLMQAAKNKLAELGLSTWTIGKIAAGEQGAVWA